MSGSKKKVVLNSVNESFPHLSRAPIVEAVIDIRARSENDWDRISIKDLLIQELPDYPKIEERRSVQAELTFNPQHQPQAMGKELGLKGYVFRSDDNVQVAQFQKDGFSFSRLKPYENWDLFVDEAHRLWEIHKKAINPIDISRLGVRFINRIEAQLPLKSEEILVDAPKTPCDFDWSFSNFFHRDVFEVPDSPYKINYIRLLEKSETHTIFILDIDVYTMSLHEPERIWSEHFSEMRYLKNKVFFGSLQESFMERLK